MSLICARSMPKGAYVCEFQRRTVASRLPEASVRPQGENNTQVMRLRCPWILLTLRSGKILQTLSRRSCPPIAKILLSIEKETLAIDWLCSWIMCMGARVFVKALLSASETLHILTLSSVLAEARRLPS